MTRVSEVADVCYHQMRDKAHNHSPFSGELSEAADSPEAEENEDKAEEGEFVPAVIDKKNKE